MISNRDIIVKMETKMMHLTNPGVSIILQHLDFAVIRALNMPMWLRHEHNSTPIKKCTTEMIFKSNK